MKKVIVFTAFISLFVSCSGPDKQSDTHTEEKCGFVYNKTQTKASWTGFKTTEKVAVDGEFMGFSTSVDGKTVETPEQLIEGTTFSIDVLTSQSGNEQRDKSLKEAFFSILVPKLTIDGKFGEIKGDKIDVTFDSFGEKILTLNYVKEENKLRAYGTIDLLGDFNADSAYNSIHTKCYDLHTGADGISKTWQIVDINISIPFSSTCK